MVYVVILVPFMPWWILCCLYARCWTEQWVARFIFHASEAYAEVFRTWEFYWDALCCTTRCFQGKMSRAGSKLLLDSALCNIALTWHWISAKLFRPMLQELPLSLSNGVAGNLPLQHLGMSSAGNRILGTNELCLWAIVVFLMRSVCHLHLSGVWLYFRDIVNE